MLTKNWVVVFLLSGNGGSDFSPGNVCSYNPEICSEFRLTRCNSVQLPRILFLFYFLFLSLLTYFCCTALLSLPPTIFIDCDVTFLLGASFLFSFLFRIQIKIHHLFISAECKNEWKWKPGKIWIFNFLLEGESSRESNNTDKI